MTHHLALHGTGYPQFMDRRELSWLDRFAERLRIALRIRQQFSERRLDAFVADVLAAQSRLEPLGEAGRAQALRDIRYRLRRDGYLAAHVVESFAMIRILSQELLGLSHFPTQIKGGLVLLHGMLAEMDTGEGKTLTATLSAATVALSGRSVHIVTVNDYLAERDANLLRPLYAQLDLSTGLVLENMSPAEKFSQYQCDIVFCTNKTLVFDYLRDRIALGDRMDALSVALDALSGRSRKDVLLPGLQYVIVDEADSVFVDEAKTPLIISSATPNPEMEAFYRAAIMLARQMESTVHFVTNHDAGQILVTEAGRSLLAALCVDLPGLWQAELRREEVVVQALTALHRFQRDVHYIVREGKAMIVDENTGRVMPDRSWEHGLQQLIEVKEAIEVTAEKEVLARISYQAFFRRYLTLSGMTGTAREVAGELAEVYGLGTRRIKPYRPSRRKTGQSRLYASAVERDCALIESVREMLAQGRAVLVGTRSIQASEALSKQLLAAGIEHHLLNAKQDSEESYIVEHAGQRGKVTIATNMAGRGTDIKLAPEVAAAGGLHVILSARHDNRRVDRQLIGRCARQGDPGSWQSLLSLDDDLLETFVPWIKQRLKRRLLANPEDHMVQSLGMSFYRLAQWNVERRHRLIRKRVMQNEYRLKKTLSFSGEME